MGVRRALDMVLTEANKDHGPLYTYGPLIHNEQVMKLLESKGVIPVDAIPHIQKGTIVIRAHGIPPEQRKLLKASGLTIIDATCPRVARVQSIVRYHTHKGYSALIVGEPDHPEVIGLKGYGNGRAYVISSIEELPDLPKSEDLIIVAQTTQEKQQYMEIVESIKKRFPEALVFDTICDATHRRQEDVRALAPHVDGIVVVGGYHSGNTRRLAQMARSTGVPTFHVETEAELDKKQLSSMGLIGVTAGASTPNWMIKKVVQEIEAIRSRKETLLGRSARYALKFLFQTNMVVSLGAFFLSCASLVLSGRSFDLIHPCLSFLYIYAMHVLNRFLDKGASFYNDPERALFYRRHRRIIVLSGLAAITGCLALSYSIGLPTFLTMVGLSILGSIYSLPILPLGRRKLGRYFRIKDIPGSKTLAQALAWGAVIALLPLLEPAGSSWLAAFPAFFFVSTVVYVRSAFFDIFQVQGDLIVGSETIAITLGEKRTLLLLKAVLLLGAIVLVAAPILSLVGPFSYLLLLCYLSLRLCLIAYERRWLYPSTRLEAMVEANLFFAGLLGLIWQFLSWPR
jgi:(E)-4-hydroxy-3-methyl-but-2-enyl pyrophosphate reductase